MTFFDIAKNLGSSIASVTLVSEKTLEKIRGAADVAIEESGPPSLSAMRIEVVDDPAAREGMAAIISMETGQPVMYEGEDGNLMSIQFPKAEPLFQRRGVFSCRS